MTELSTLVGFPKERPESEESVLYWTAIARMLEHRHEGYPAETAPGFIVHSMSSWTMRLPDWVLGELT